MDRGDDGEQEDDPEDGAEGEALRGGDGRDAHEDDGDALEHGRADEVERATHPLHARDAALEHEGARDVHREVDAEADAYDARDARDAVRADAPPAHEAEHAEDDREDADDEPKAAQRLRDEEERDNEDDHHADARLQHRPPSVG